MLDFLRYAFLGIYYFLKGRFGLAILALVGSVLIDRLLLHLA